jgi:hypothetical protein
MIGLSGNKTLHGEFMNLKSKKGRKIGILTNNQREKIRELSKHPTTDSFSRQTKSEIYRKTQRAAIKALDDLKFLAKHLPEKKQAIIFSTDFMGSLIDEVLAYSEFQEAVARDIPRIGRGYVSDEELKKDKLMLRKDVTGKVRKFLPKEEKNHKKKVYRVYGGKKTNHPSKKRQYQLARIFLDRIYERMLEKVDPKRGKLMAKSSWVLELSENTFEYTERSAWLKKIMEKALKKEWSEQLVDQWLSDVTKEIGELDFRMKEWVMQLLECWCFQIAIKGKDIILPTNKILILKQNETD